SQEKFTGNGGISFTVTQEGTDSIMVGLSSSNSDAGYASIGYAVYLFINRIYIFESGAFRGSFGTYLDGDSFSVERTDSTIDYKKNGTVFYTSATTTNAALLADFAIHNSGGAISNVGFNININQVKISWNANTETDLMGYRVYYGTSSGNYGSPISVGKTKTSCALDLARGMTNYFAVTAVDWSGNESLFSSEESYDVP
ncbi:MAG: hypothetical protein GY775_19195, partial [Candidatus Scalindua sp.]|nr:hypothetical protein [Candidatus Scalindua sp.]